MIFAFRRMLAGQADPEAAVFYCWFGTFIVIIGLLAATGTVEWLTGAPLFSVGTAWLLTGVYLAAAVTGARRCFRNARLKAGAI